MCFIFYILAYDITETVGQGGLDLSRHHSRVHKKRGSSDREGTEI